MSLDPAKIFSKNAVNEDDTLALSHSSASAPYLYDGDPLSKWISSGANSDATEISIEVVFYEGSQAIDRDIDALVLLNHNLKAPTIEYFTGGAYAGVASVTPSNPLVLANNVIRFTKVTTSKMRIRCSTTQITNAEKFIGELILCEALITLGNDFESFDPQPRQKKKEIVLGDGSIHQYLTKCGPNRTTKFGLRGKYWANATPDTHLDALKLIIESGDAFMFQPESTARPQDWFQCHWVGPLICRYKSNVKTAGYLIDVNVREV